MGFGGSDCGAGRFRLILDAGVDLVADEAGDSVADFPPELPVVWQPRHDANGRHAHSDDLPQQSHYVARIVVAIRVDSPLT